MSFIRVEQNKDLVMIHLPVITIIVKHRNKKFEVTWFNNCTGVDSSDITDHSEFIFASLRDSLKLTTLFRLIPNKEAFKAHNINCAGMPPEVSQMAADLVAEQIAEQRKQVKHNVKTITPEKIKEVLKDIKEGKGLDLDKLFNSGDGSKEDWPSEFDPNDFPSKKENIN